MLVAVDWDNTLYTVEDGWLPDAKRALKVLRRQGNTVVVHSCRAGWAGGREFIIAALVQAGFPDIEVTDVKPNADVFIDDRAIPFDGDWSVTLKDIKARS